MDVAPGYRHGHTPQGIAQAASGPPTAHPRLRVSRGTLHGVIHTVHEVVDNNEPLRAITLCGTGRAPQKFKVLTSESVPIEGHRTWSWLYLELPYSRRLRMPPRGVSIREKTLITETTRGELGNHVLFRRDTTASRDGEQAPRAGQPQVIEISPRRSPRWPRSRSRVPRRDARGPPDW